MSNSVWLVDLTLTLDFPIWIVVAQLELSCAGVVILEEEVDEQGLAR